MHLILLWWDTCEAQSAIHETLQQNTTWFDSALHISLYPSLPHIHTHTQKKSCNPIASLDLSQSSPNNHQSASKEVSSSSNNKIKHQGKI